MSVISTRGALVVAPNKSRSAAVLVCGLALALLVALGFAGRADAATYVVSGKQTVVDEAKGTSKMTGGLVGDWKITSFKTLAKAPLYRAKGTERFEGCLDRGHDGSCSGDPSGTLKFEFVYWAKFEAGDSLVWGSCLHPVTGGSGDFAGANGVLAMVDTPEGKAVTTRYSGNLTLGGSAGAAAASAARPRCG